MKRRASGPGLRTMILRRNHREPPFDILAVVGPDARPALVCASIFPLAPHPNNRSPVAGLWVILRTAPPEPSPARPECNRRSRLLLPEGQRRSSSLGRASACPIRQIAARPLGIPHPGRPGRLREAYVMVRMTDLHAGELPLLPPTNGFTTADLVPRKPVHPGAFDHRLVRTIFTRSCRYTAFLEAACHAGTSAAMECDAIRDIR